MRNHLGIGFGGELVSRLKATTEFPVILNDAVVDYGDLMFAVEMRVSVGTSNPTMSCPADMPNTYFTRQPIRVVFFYQFSQLAHLFLKPDGAISDGSYASRIIAAILLFP